MRSHVVWQRGIRPLVEGGYTCRALTSTGIAHLSGLWEGLESRLSCSSRTHAQPACPTTKRATPPPMLLPRAPTCAQAMSEHDEMCGDSLGRPERSVGLSEQQALAGECCMEVGGKCPQGYGGLMLFMIA